MDAVGRGKQFSMCPEDQIFVQDHGQSGTLSPRPLSQYLSADVSARMINSSAPRTMAIINQEIISVNAIIESLKVLHILKRQTRNGCSPVSRLPQEILGQIFIKCLDGDERDRDDAEFDNLDLRLILGQVCSAWRMVAWGLSTLWTTVHCRVTHPDKSKKMAGLLYQWLLRAQDLPTSVKVDFTDEEVWAKLGTNAPIDILDALMPFHRTWRTLDLTLPASWQRHLNAFNSLRFVSLEGLKIRPLSSTENDGIHMEGFLHAPKLCSLVFVSYPLWRLYFTWTNLTHGTFGGPSLNEVAELLSRCANLTTCHISNPVPSEVIDFGSSIFHTNLQELRIFIDLPAIRPAPRVAFQILDLLTAPQLQNISLTLPIHYTDPLTNIWELLERSKCSLKTVEVFGPTISEVQIIEFLSESSVRYVHNN